MSNSDDHDEEVLNYDLIRSLPAAIRRGGSIPREDLLRAADIFDSISQNDKVLDFAISVNFSRPGRALERIKQRKRNEILREAVKEFCLKEMKQRRNDQGEIIYTYDRKRTLPERAAELLKQFRRYITAGGWSRDDQCSVVCPARHQGKIDAYLWHALRADQTLAKLKKKRRKGVECGEYIGLSQKQMENILREKS
jgi:hypothetical protein